MGGLCAQVFGKELRARLPNVTRLAQTVLWHPKAVGVMRARLQPPAQAHEYTQGAANTWGSGPNPVKALDWTFTAHAPWTGVAALVSRIAVPCSPPAVHLVGYCCRVCEVNGQSLCTGTAVQLAVVLAC